MQVSRYILSTMPVGCSLCVEAVFLTIDGMLIEGNCGLTVGLLIKLSTDLTFHSLRIYATRLLSQDFPSGLGRDIEFCSALLRSHWRKPCKYRGQNIPHNAASGSYDPTSYRPAGIRRGVAVHLLAKFHALDD